MAKKFLILSVLAVLIFGCKKDPEEITLGIPMGGNYSSHGQELVTGLASCGVCHGNTPSPDAPLSGGQKFVDRYGELYAPNLTPSRSGLANWSVNDIIRALRSSTAKDGRPLSVEMHDGFEWMSDSDALAIAAYIKSLPPVENVVPKRELTWLDRNIIGFMEKRKTQSGYVPRINPKYEVEYGKYLAENIARISECFEYPEDEESNEFSLAALFGFSSNQKAYVSLKDWTEEDIVYFLQSGENPQGKQISKTKCHYEFFRNAPESDLRAIATYLKSIEG